MMIKDSLLLIVTHLAARSSECSVMSVVLNQQSNSKSAGVLETEVCQIRPPLALLVFQHRFHLMAKMVACICEVQSRNLCDNRRR